MTYIGYIHTGCAKKRSYLQNAAGAMGQRTLVQSPKDGTPWAWKMLFGRFLLRLSKIKRSQVMSMGKFDPTALNFGYDFFC